MCDETNYQKLVDPHPPPYDIFFGYQRWDNNSRRRFPHPCQTKTTQCVCPPKKPTQCPTEPSINVYVHLLPGNGGGKIRNFTPEKFKSTCESVTEITNKKTPFQISGDLFKVKKIIKNKTVLGNDGEVKIKQKEIQKSSSCVFNKSSLDLKKKEKVKKSESENKKKWNSNDAVSEKKEKSWDPFQKIPTASSKTSLAQRVSDVLEKVKEKPSLKLDLSLKTSDKVGYKSLFSEHTKQLASDESFKKFCDNKQLPEKSVSSQLITLSNQRLKRVCKSNSLEARSIRKTDKNLVFLDQYKNNFVNVPETLPKPDRMQSSMLRHSELTDNLSNLKELCSERVTPILSRCFLKSKPGWRYPVQPQCLKTEKFTNQSFTNGSHELFFSDKQSPQIYHPSEKYNNQFWQQIPTMEKNLSICQCPHVHTEEGMKQVCLQSSSDPQEYGQKFFRVNYIPKEEINESDEEKEYVDKGTTTEIEVVRRKPKIIKSAEGKQIASLKTTDSDSNNKNGNCKSGIYNHQKHGLSESPKCSTKVLRIVKQEQVKKKEEKNSTEAAATEVETLRELFTKLNAVERLLEKKKCEATQEKSNARKSSQKEKVRETSEAKEAETKGQSKELKAEIVRHMRHWLDAEFNDG